MSDEETSKQPPAETSSAQHHVLMELKRTKTRYKSAFTRHKNKLIAYVEKPDLDKRLVRELQSNLDRAQDDLFRTYEKLVQFYQHIGDEEGEDLITNEIESIDKEYSNAQLKVSQTLEKTVNFKENAVGKDLWKQMKRVSIPIFNGEKMRYESWKAAFMACIDAAPATAEYKLLQLRQHLEGEALRCIENLGHSEAAYDAAKQRLERKFGGKKRQVQMFLEELDSFPVMKDENAVSLEKFSDILDIAVINLTESGHLSDLGNGALFIRLQKKLPLNMLSRYHRWVHENDEEESVKSLREWVIEESKFKTIASETIFGLNRSSKTRRDANRSTYFTNSKQKQSERTCKLCNGPHGIWACEAFKQLPTSQRWDKARSLSLCYRCLGVNHVGRDCHYSRECGIGNCKKIHHRLLHCDNRPSENVQQQPEFQQNTNIPVITHASHNADRKFIGLRTVPVIVQYGQKQIKIYALLDDGSTQTFINKDVVMELGVPVNQHSMDMTVNVLNGQTKFCTSNVTLGLVSLNGQIRLNIDANTIENVTGKLRAIDINHFSNKFNHLKGIQFPNLEHKHVDMLIGLDYPDLHQSLYEIHGKPGEPIARLTPLGWTCVGNFEFADNCSFMTHTFLLHHDDRNNDLNGTLRRFWEVDQGILESDTLSRDDHLLLQKTEESVKVVKDRYQVEIPWNENKDRIRNNFEMAHKRLRNTEQRLIKTPELYEKYDEIIQTYCKKGYISKVEDVQRSDSWFIPHFPVLRPDKSTSKVRIVFDASAKHNGISLNDAINQGPPLQTDLFDVMTRFRRHSVAIACDIQEMYLQVGIPENDRCYHRFLWRSRSDGPIHVYEFNRLVFGINASPFLAQCVAQHNARIYENQFPMAATTVLKSTYMDDSLDSVKTVLHGKQLYEQLSALWAKAGMYARKWFSNSQEVLERVPPEDRALESNFLQDDNEQVGIKTLGVLWQAKDDSFTFRLSTVGQIPLCSMTKRQYLKKISTLYDPLGFLVPYIIRAKILMQEIWLSGIDWDENIPPELMIKVSKWFKDLECLDEICIPRNLRFRETDCTEVHTFVDASTLAYCAVVYIRTQHGKGDVFETNIVASKSKVTPLKSTSVPRLELMAAVLGLRLSDKVCRALEFKIDDVIFWSDSMNTLWWIRNQSRQFKPFVANRLGEIQSKTNPNQWRYVPTEQNPADQGSRGIATERLCTEQFWWKGPKFLSQVEELWPKNKFGPNEGAENCEKQKHVLRAHSDEAHLKIELEEMHITAFLSGKDCANDNLVQENRLEPERYSRWLRLIRVYAWVIRFIDNCRKPKSLREIGKVLQADELISVETKVISQSQKQCFSDEYKCLLKGTELSRSSKIVKLNPKIDEDGIMRSDSRLRYIDYVPYETRCPIILPRKSWVTKLIVREHHIQNKHGGTNHTLALLSSRYWVISAREVIREIETECYECRRRKAKSAQQIMGPIPEFRIGQKMRAFTQTAVDYAGPFFTKQGRGRPRIKRYLCLFTCMACRAVHLELSFNMDTDGFLNAFYRFVNRRGLPEVMVSDNGTNFVGAVRELREMTDNLDKEKIAGTTANQGVKWLFNPPAAPHFGGVHESMIKSAKRAIYAILGNAEVNDEELMTAFTGAENLVNSRPLTYQSSNPCDEPVLTPNHFLHGQLGGQFAPQNVDSTSFNIRKRWRRVQELVKHFWKRWFQEFVPTLGARKKWLNENHDFAVGDVVIVMDPDLGRGQWRIGRIVKTYRGIDNHVRVVDILINNKILKRPVIRLCPLVSS